MADSLKTSLSNNPKVWILIGIGVAGIAVVVSRERSRRREKKLLEREDFGAFVERFELLPFPQPPPPAAPLSLYALSFAVKDMFVISFHHFSDFTILQFSFFFNLFLTFEDFDCVWDDADSR